MLGCKSQFYVDVLLGLECIFDFVSQHLHHCRPVFDLCSVLQLCLLKHFTCFHYRERSEVLGGKVVMKTVNFMVVNRIITGCMQLLNSLWTFGLSIRKILAIKPTNLHSFFFPSFSPNLWPEPFAQPRSPCQSECYRRWIRPLKSNTPQFCTRVELDLSWGMLLLTINYLSSKVISAAWLLNVSGFF